MPGDGDRALTVIGITFLSITTLWLLFGIYRGLSSNANTGGSRTCANCYGGNDMATHYCDPETCTAVPIPTIVSHEFDRERNQFVEKRFYSFEEYEAYAKMEALKYPQPPASPDDYFPGCVNTCENNTCGDGDPSQHGIVRVGLAENEIEIAKE